ncbi:hypothetical protein [Amycolatopsis sp. 195334CR]|uniref:hypothetical protein n=1 Tax=Amycolatopsis sp. 195334CR TaxID=2814588 RepID=UPI001A8CBE4A|nr:hypothetical protein [Amycolatopsis sp. 195334CR]MBN6037460.1 hypothetical protein [Amycolatopsis sp. 195334CR]
MYMLIYDGQTYRAPSFHSAEILRTHVIEKLKTGPFWLPVEPIQEGERYSATLLISQGASLAIVETS